MKQSDSQTEVNVNTGGGGAAEQSGGGGSTLVPANQEAQLPAPGTVSDLNPAQGSTQGGESGAGGGTEVNINTPGK